MTLHRRILVTNNYEMKDAAKAGGFWFHSRFVKIRRMEGLRVVGRVCVERVAVVESVRLPRSLVLGKVPAGGELRLQSLWGHVNRG